MRRAPSQHATLSLQVLTRLPLTVDDEPCLGFETLRRHYLARPLIFRSIGGFESTVQSKTQEPAPRTGRGERPAPLGEKGCTSRRLVLSWELRPQDRHPAQNPKEGRAQARREKAWSGATLLQVSSTTSQKTLDSFSPCIPRGVDLGKGAAATGGATPPTGTFSPSPSVGQRQALSASGHCRQGSVLGPELQPGAGRSAGGPHPRDREPQRAGVNGTTEGAPAAPATGNPGIMTT